MLGEHSRLGEKRSLRRKTPEEYATLTKELRKRCLELGIAFIIANLEETSCLHPFVMAFIDVDGYLTPCCKLEHIRLANVFETSLFQAWNAQPMRKWRRNLLVGRIPKVCLDIRCITK
jgi:MoaA/NifB/PqqE/SkfB family radical SAM enzyme